MKPVAPRRIAVYITLSFLTLTILFILVNNLFANGLLVLIIAVPIFTMITFFVVNYFLNSFIYAKIKPIYKTIRISNPNEDFLPLTMIFSAGK